MEHLVLATSQRGYSILFILVFLEAVGFPVPADEVVQLPTFL
ncbi:MAG: hypothetical protein ABSG41_14225 [Bryobacteraceae bacterium]|jgi:membrane protein YqaA with SNARE-associated domain